MAYVNHKSEWNWFLFQWESPGYRILSCFKYNFHELLLLLFQSWKGMTDVFNSWKNIFCRMVWKLLSFKMCIQDRVFSLVWIAFLLTTTGIHLVTSEEGKLVNSWVTLNPRLPCAVTIVFMFIFFLVWHIANINWSNGIHVCLHQYTSGLPANSSHNLVLSFTPADWKL